MAEAIIIQDNGLNILEKIKTAGTLCRIAKFEELMADSFEHVCSSKTMEYLGELNQNDLFC